ncbi:hypothetical protein [Noviherbaspirillum galbum]|uniref:Uncharacterized protein n=1 Tax=Noviherbaspirillum galbum TaxID=2709383 RepID=A0A6B3SH86_9BURK|nr:hypothetical protein [Noviherbaspirillum galbum]NEX60214.1 hypothetical protein [Noviherbaspirillum galbum]
MTTPVQEAACSTILDTPLTYAVTMTIAEWQEQFRPVTNHLVPGADFNGTAFETYGVELKHVLAISVAEPNRVWTALSTDHGIAITNGMAWVNRLLYFVTELPAQANVNYDIHDHDDDEQCSQCEAVLDGDGWNGKCGHCADAEDNKMEGLALAKAHGLSWYRVGDVYTLDKAGKPIPAHNLDKWFISAQDGTPAADGIADLPFSNSEDEARDLAIQYAYTLQSTKVTSA